MKTSDPNTVRDCPRFDSLCQPVRDEAHSACFVCAPNNPAGLQVRFVPQPDCSVAAEFHCDGAYQGYNGIIHGGIVSTLLDAAMTNCLFAMGHVAVTADLHVRFRHALHTGQDAVVRAWVTRFSLPLVVLQAQVIQAGQIKAIAVGKFMRKNPPLPGEEP